ncbi:hypothetical protein GQ44DRAFT_706876 [Phaeosphaeriaceae sp. PMI808]|nr:hypothetical protein GQ44DRAFT_706876 [Phaeosphaeriaceae sp. PMI808]
MRLIQYNMTSMENLRESANGEARAGSPLTSSEMANNTTQIDQADTSPLDELMSDADLYVVTPPAYTQSIADGEVTIDAEAVQDEKPPTIPERSSERDALLPTSSRPMSTQPTPRSETPPDVEQARKQEDVAVESMGPPPEFGHYLTEPGVIASLVGIRACSILHDRPAVWLVKNSKMALSPLAAAVLTKEGLIGVKELELVSQHPSARRDPTDPLSGVMLGVYDSVGEIMLGLVAGPVELGRQATPMLVRFEHRQRSNPDGNTQPVTTQDVKGAPHAAARVAVEAGKGLCRVATAALKTPVLTTHGVTRGFHNLPKLYGEEVRQYENVTGIKSGLLVSAKSFGYGIGDGLLDFVAKPIQGAEQKGLTGFATGFAKGVGNLVCKPAAGACGLLGYSAVGVYKEIRNIKLSKREMCPADLVQKLGEAEYEDATDSDKLHVVRIWCQTMMHVRLT